MAGDWPNLSDKMPDPATRARVIERVGSAAQPRSIESAPVTTEQAETLLQSVQAAAADGANLLNEAFRVLDDRMAENDQEAMHLWLEAQLALTRLSHTASRLDPIIFSADLLASDVHKKSRAEKDRIDAIVIEARQKLAEKYPAHSE